MLCPEVWNFKAPRHNFQIHKQLKEDSAIRVENKNKNRATDTIKTHYFNHSVSVVLPNISNIPESFNENFLEDSDYYKITSLHAVELINKKFIESFVKKGEFYLLTIKKKIDLENLIAITPTGHLLLSLVRTSYQNLGIEGKPTFFERKEHSRYVVTIDLKDENLVPGKKYYERIRTSLDKLLDLTFDVIISWDPPEENVCPSSAAAWFHKRGFQVNVCHQQMIRRSEYSLDIPVLENCNYYEFFEWLGVFSTDGNLVNENEDESENEESQYVSSYECPKPKLHVHQIQYVQFTGFFTRRKIKRIFDALKDYMTSNNTILPWCSMDVQGFDDSPVSWGLKEHSFYTDGDNSYTLVLCNSDGGYILRRSLSSNNKPKIKQ